MMTKRNRNIKNIFIKLQFSTNIMANEVKTPIQNYFEKVLYMSFPKFRSNTDVDIGPVFQERHSYLTSLCALDHRGLLRFLFFFPSTLKPQGRNLKSFKGQMTRFLIFHKALRNTSKML
jgi:hypothetical protein